jgi:hypothetical protein
VKTKRKVAGKNWKFDGSTLTVHVPMTWKRRGGRKVIIAPDGGDPWAPAKPRPDNTLIHALREVSVGGGDRRSGRRDA